MSHLSITDLCFPSAKGGNKSKRITFFGDFHCIKSLKHLTSASTKKEKANANKIMITVYKDTGCMQQVAKLYFKPSDQLLFCEVVLILPKTLFLIRPNPV